MDLNDDKQAREALLAGEILLGEYLELSPLERVQSRSVREKSQHLLMRAESARLMLQGRLGMLLRHEYGGPNPNLGLTVFYGEDGNPVRVALNQLITPVKADDGAMGNETGEFAKFPPLYVFKPSEAHERFDQWWARTVAPLIEHYLEQAAAEGPNSTLLFVRMLTAAAWSEAERRKGRD